MTATPGEVFAAFLAGCAIGAFCMLAWITYLDVRREERADDHLLENYGVGRDDWNAMSAADRELVRLAFRARQDREAER